MSAATVFDSQLFGNIFGTKEIRACFSETSYVARLIEAECALAEAEEEEGVIPKGTAATIRAHSDVGNINWPVLAEKTEIVGYPVLPLIEQMLSWVPEEAGRFGVEMAPMVALEALFANVKLTSRVHPLGRYNARHYGSSVDPTDEAGAGNCIKAIVEPRAHPN